jgi:hypothetical protein
MLLPLPIVLPLPDVYDTDYQECENRNSDQWVPNELSDTPHNRPIPPTAVGCWMLRCTPPGYPYGKAQY